MSTSSPPQPDPPPGLPQIWNHRIHQRWAGEDLAFWRLAFFPTYNFPEIKTRLHALMQQFDIKAYTIYETLGLFDLFIRAWLPSQSIEGFQNAITEELAGQGLQLCEPFLVSRILRHWAWDDGHGKLVDPSDELLRTRRPSAMIAAIDDGTAPEQTRQELLDGNALRDLGDEGDGGIKFLIVISSSIYSMTYAARGRLEQSLLNILDDHDLGEPSLYEGSGFGQFILMGRVQPQSFFILPELAVAINKAGIQDTARPYTFVSSTEKPIYFADRISHATDTVFEPLDLDALLAGGEDDHLEVKGSAWLDWRRRLSGDGEDKRSQKVINDGLVKAVVGMLNADGGHVVLGALEQSARFGEHHGEDHPRLAELPRVGEYVLVGVNDEYDARGWDKFRRGLLDVLSSRIDPPPTGAITLSRQAVSGRDICIVAIAPTSATWYYRYLSENVAEFFVRENGRTVAYSGSRADTYKRERPRR